jgi:hypothetical protein
MKPQVLLVLGGLAGFLGAGAAWFFAGSWYTRRLGQKYSPAGDIGMPSEEVFDAVFATLVGTPVVVVVGGVIGTLLAWRLVRPENS